MPELLAHPPRPGPERTQCPDADFLLKTVKLEGSVGNLCKNDSEKLFLLPFVSALLGFREQSEQRRHPAPSLQSLLCLHLLDTQYVPGSVPPQRKGKGGPSSSLCHDVPVGADASQG